MAVSKRPPKDELQALVNQGLDNSALSARYVVPRQTVQNWRLYYGFPARRVSKRPSKQQLAEAIAAHRTLQDVADHYGVSYDTLWKWRRHYRLTTDVRGARHWNAVLEEADIPLIRKLHEEGMSAETIADKFGVHPRTIYCILRYETWRHVA